MIDLCVHLNGSVSAQALIKLANDFSVQLPAEGVRALKPYISVPKKSTSLEEYQACFEIPNLVLQTEGALKYAASELVKKLDENKMRYVEIRFAPQLHTKGGLSQKDAVEAVIAGIKEGLGSCEYMNAGLLLCCIGANEKEDIKTIDIAKSLLGSGVVGVDISAKSKNFDKLISYTKELGMDFVICASEAGMEKKIKSAVNMGVKRIRYGSCESIDEEILAMVIDKGIALEMCPTSALHRGLVNKIKEYPIRSLLKKGVIVTVCTDNMTASDTDIKKEYTLLKNSLSLTAEEEKMLLLNAGYASFLSEEESQNLCEQIYEYGLYI